MHVSAILAVVVALQVASTSPPERTPDLRNVLNNNAALSSIEVLYRVEGQVIDVHGDGTVLKQSTRQQLPLLPTCKGMVALVDVRRLLEVMLAEQFFDLPQKSYVVINEDWRTLRMHSISIKAAGGSAKRDFSAGEYDGKRQEIPENFARVEKAITELESKAISSKTHCTVDRPF
jgi:hypothetical protein